MPFNILPEPQPEPDIRYIPSFNQCLCVLRVVKCAEAYRVVPCRVELIEFKLTQDEH